jgi:excisionase family DNA binding protein
MNRLLTIKQASEYLNVSQDSLRKWDKSGKLIPFTTSGGHRRYLREDLDKFIGFETQVTSENNIVAIYSRVSSNEQKQKGDLDRQAQRLSEYCANKKLNVGYIIKDIGSGLSDKRVGFINLSNLVTNKKINKVVIEHKDRLTRFQYNFIESMFKSYGVEIIYIENKDISEENDLVMDVISLMASFSGKIYGRRSAQRKINKC